MSAPTSRFRVLISAFLVLAVGGGAWFVMQQRQGQNEEISSAIRLEDYTPDELPPDRKAFVRQELREALDPDTHPRKRIDLLRAFESKLSDEECRLLLHALHARRPAAVAEEWHAEYVQQICQLLQDQDELREEYARVLATLARDAKRDRIVRDYALQHLRVLWDRSGESLRDSVEEAFREVIRGGDSLAAPAMLSLHLLGAPVRPAESLPNARLRTPAALDTLARRSTVSNPTFHLPDSELEPSVRQILAMEPAAPDTALRMTAIRIVADRKLFAFKPDLGRIVADTAREHAVVRMAAIAAIARFADPADRPLLQAADRSDPRIDRAVRLALSESL